MSQNYHTVGFHLYTFYEHIEIRQIYLVKTLQILAYSRNLCKSSYIFLSGARSLDTVIDF